MVAAILDTFSERCLSYEVNLVGLSPKDWPEKLEQSQPEFLLVESVETKNKGAWRNILTNYLKQEFNPLRDLLQYCRKHSVPPFFGTRKIFEF